MGNGSKATFLTVFAFVCALLAHSSEAATCSGDAINLRGDWGAARFSVEIADDQAERSQGLMNRPSMPSSAGMFFVYDQPSAVSFWMRNTLIPLDIIFADSSGIVRHIHHEAVPLDETPIPGGSDIQYVLEINGGLARAMGINVGTQFHHPSLAQDKAAWPC
ncbi:MAG: DUF192 domain-containing protein [Pseudomonadota bacterium]